MSPCRSCAARDTIHDFVIRFTQTRASQPSEPSFLVIFVTILTDSLTQGTIQLNGEFNGPSEGKATSSQGKGAEMLTTVTKGMNYTGGGMGCGGRGDL